MSMTDLAEPPGRRVRTLQAVWKTELLMRESRGAQPCFEDDTRDRGEPLEVELALGEFSRRVSRGEAEERLFAVRALAWLADRRAISPLIRALGDSEWDVRLAAVSGLAERDPLPEWSVEPLSATLTDPDPAIRATAVKALGTVPSHAVGPIVRPMLEDAARSVVVEAVWALGDLARRGFPEPSARDGLVAALLQEQDPWLAYAAFWTLGWLAESDPVRAQFRYSDWGQRVWEVVTWP